MPQPIAAPICKQLEEMSEEELVAQRTRAWSICKSDTGFWVRVDDAPFRYFGAMLRMEVTQVPEWDKAMIDAQGYLEKYGMPIKTYIFY